MNRSRAGSSEAGDWHCGSAQAPRTAGRRRRLFFDITYARVQRDSVGITRTVRRMFEEIQARAVAAKAVVFNRDEFHQISAPARDQHNAASPPGWLFRLATSGFGKFVVALLMHLPWPVVRPLWEYVSGRAYSTSGDDARPARFLPGDLVLLCDACWNYGVWVAARRARAQGAHVVLVVYDIMPLRHPEFCAPLLVRVVKGWLSEMLACTDALVCISAATEQDLRDWARTSGRVLPPTSHFRLGSDPVAATRAGPIRGELADFLGRPGACFAAVGSVEPKKNYGFLLDVFESLWAEGAEMRLVIAGRVTPEWKAEGERMRLHAQQGRRLLTLFDATDAEIAQIYSASRALVLPSLLEGFGLPLVEARARGCPVIASDLPVFLELADAGVFLYDRHSADALRTRLREHMGTDLRVSVGSMPPFTWSDSAAQCLQVIDVLLHGPTGAAAAAADAA
jgi:glycosyltransferase involved in cell wall biosynthesis